MINEPDQALRDEVNRLGHLLGETLELLEGKSVFAHVELARRTARDRRDGVIGAQQRFERVLRGLSVDEAMSVSRAFSSYFGLVNLAERVHHVHRWRRTANDNVTMDGTFLSALGKLKDNGFSAQQSLDLIANTLFKPVFTAHPTQAVRRTLLIKEQRIARPLIEALGRPSDAVTTAAMLDDIRNEIALAWQTDEHFSQPSVADEVEHVLFYLSDVLYRALPMLYRRMHVALESTYGNRAQLQHTPQLVRFGSWVGGDMDGNPNVNAKTITETLERQRKVIIECYRREVRDLFDRLSQSLSRISISAALDEHLSAYLDKFPSVAETIPSRYQDMPYRMFLWSIWHRLGATLEDRDDAYREPSEFIADLQLIVDSLSLHGSTGAHWIDDLILRVQCFGFHFTALDVRQDARVHREAVAQALGQDDFAMLEAEQRRVLIGAAIDSGASAKGNGDALTSCLEVMRAIAMCLKRFGPRAIGLYIISMARDVDDALAVLYLSQLACDDGNDALLDIAPLFETVDDLSQAPKTMRALLEDATYTAHLRGRGQVQHVMLGYSDSNKQAGMAASRVALHQAQRALVADFATRGDTEFVIFHGRGGTISRGGGETRNGVLAEPPGALSGTLRVTEQGEIIGQKYGLPEVATQTMELAIASLLERRVDARMQPLSETYWFDVADAVANASRHAYQNLVHHAQFNDYFRRATPIDVIERMRIGSRPPSRKAAASVDGLRAIPWVFAWTQSRYSLTGWFGLGSGLTHAREEFGLKTLRSMARSWRFFATLLSDAEMVLAKSDMAIASMYASLADSATQPLHGHIVEEFERTTHQVCEILEQDHILEHNPRLAHVLTLRDVYVDPLHVIQVDYLARWRDTNFDDQKLERVLAETVRGIARGMQNTG